MNEDGEMAGLRTKAEWDAYRALPEWEVTVELAAKTRLRAHGAIAEDAVTRVLKGENGVQWTEDPGDLETRITRVIRVSKVEGQDERGS